MISILHRKSVLAGLLIIALILISACNTRSSDETPNRAERPDATSTPVVGAESTADESESGSAGEDASSATGGNGGTVPAEATPAPLPPEQIGSLSTEEQLQAVVMPTRDLRDLALRLKEIDEIPTVVNESAPDYEVGTQLQFWVHNVDENTNARKNAELVYKTDVAYAWVEAGQPVNRTALIESVDNFSETAYPLEVEFFGSESNPGIDNDPRIHILHTTGTGFGVAGYFSSADQYSSLANEFSNEKEMFYINLDWLNRARDFEYYETVLSHEFQHMIHWANDRNEETWLNEGMSEFAQEVAGYPPDTTFASAFGNKPDTQLNTWNESTASNAEHYGSAYLFVNYFAQRYGSERTEALVANAANGIDSVDNVLAAAGLQERFVDVFGDWVVANYVDDPNALGEDGRYGYRGFSQRAPILDEQIASYPTEIASTVNNQATDYILLEGEGDVVIEFTGETETRLAATNAFSGDYAWWANRGDDSDTRLTRIFDLSSVAAGDPVEMTVTMWWDIETDYDYGYVVASRDGVKWQILSGQKTTTENPNGNSFGDAYTARSTGNDGSSQWVVETFDLSDYAGEEVYVRFEYVTDDAVNSSGWFIDDISLDAIGYSTDFENGADGWESEGWLLTDNLLSQGWLVQLLTLDDNILSNVQRIVVDESGTATLAVDELSNDRTAVLAISALAPVTTEPAHYEFVATER